MGINYYWHRLVIALARKVPYETGSITALGVFLPIVACIFIVPESIRSLMEIPFIQQLVPPLIFYLIEGVFYVLAGFLSFTFFCRLLQICEPHKYDRYKIEERKSE